MTDITEHSVRTDRHETFYLECGPPDGPLMIFVHGWPALSIMWRRQLQHFGALGYRCVAPDMRGYGRSGAPPACCGCPSSSCTRRTTGSAKRSTHGSPNRCAAIAAISPSTSSTQATGCRKNDPAT